MFDLLLFQNTYKIDNRDSSCSSFLELSDKIDDAISRAACQSVRAMHLSISVCQSAQSVIPIGQLIALMSSILSPFHTQFVHFALPSSRPAHSFIHSARFYLISARINTNFSHFSDPKYPQPSMPDFPVIYGLNESPLLKYLQIKILNHSLDP